jgi:AcrR family transcriptional regulator
MPERIRDEQLLEGAQRALGRYGPQRATLARIAEQAGVSRVTLHRRGVTREGLIASLTERAAESYRQALWPALTGPGTGLERLECALRAICEVAESNLALLLALDAQSEAVFHDGAADVDEEVATRSEFTDPLERLLIDGHADGTLRDGDPLETATVLFNQVSWSYLHLRSGHRWAADRARRVVVESALHGAAAR